MKKEQVYRYTGDERLNILNGIGSTNIWLVPNKDYLLSDESIGSSRILEMLVKKGYLVPRGTSNDG